MKTTNTPNLKMTGLLLIGMFTFFSLSAYGQSTETIKGEVLDMSCYMTSGAKGEGHAMCAQACLDKGLPAGILSESGQVYLLVENHDKADAYKKVVKHAADMVKITGKVVEKNGVQSLIVEEVEVLEG